MVSARYTNLPCSIENVLREVREETGLTVTLEQLTGVYYERKGPGFEVLHFAFRCRAGNSAAVSEANSPEITQCVYWPLDALPRPISDFTLRRIRDTLEAVPKYSLPEVLGPSRPCHPTRRSPHQGNAECKHRSDAAVSLYGALMSAVLHCE